VNERQVKIQAQDIKRIKDKGNHALAKEASIRIRMWNKFQLPQGRRNNIFLFRIAADELAARGVEVPS